MKRTFKSLLAILGIVVCLAIMVGCIYFVATTDTIRSRFILILVCSGIMTLIGACITGIILLICSTEKGAKKHYY